MHWQTNGVWCQTPLGDAHRKIIGRGAQESAKPGIPDHTIIPNIFPTKHKQKNDINEY